MKVNAAGSLRAPFLAPIRCTPALLHNVRLPVIALARARVESVDEPKAMFPRERVFVTQHSEQPVYDYQTVKVEFEDGIAWVSLNRPEKKNAMSPTLNAEMYEALDALEFDDRCKILVLTGAGESFSSGMDLKEYFRETDGASAQVKSKVRYAAGAWQWRKLRFYPKPT